MRKLLILFILLSTLVTSCIKQAEPEPEAIRAYCSLYNFIPGMGSVIWEVDGSEVPDEQIYAELFQGSLILESETDEMVFAVKHPGTREVLVNQLFPLEKDKFYTVIVGGSEDDPTLLINEIETSQPAAGKVKFQVLHAMPDQGPVDLYMGDTTVDKRVLTALEYLDLTDPFEVSDFDARVFIAATAHSEEYDPDSLLIQSEYNDQVISGASYLTVLAHETWITESDLTFWLYSLPVN
jgi:hypothetical protein